MKFYLAPMEGLTGYVYRNAYHTYFNQVDRYFSPFIVAGVNRTLSSREKNDILPENNQGMDLIPQILTNDAKAFMHTAEQVRELGHKEINLNLGCPSRTVVSKNRGAGFLAKTEELERFLDEIFAASKMRISIKTRIGLESPDEFYKLLELYNKFPVEELIIHPRTQQDYYKNQPNWEVFKDAVQMSKNPVCYNGDIFTKQNYETFVTAFPSVEYVMLGRGILHNPNLIGAINQNPKLEKETLRAFHDMIYEEYQKILFGDRNILFKMKELWGYMIALFSDHAKYAKKIKKSERLSDYEKAVWALFQEQHIMNSCTK